VWVVVTRRKLSRGDLLDWYDRGIRQELELSIEVFSPCSTMSEYMTWLSNTDIVAGQSLLLGMQNRLSHTNVRPELKLRFVCSRYCDYRLGKTLQLLGRVLEYVRFTHARLAQYRSVEVRHKSRSMRVVELSMRMKKCGLQESLSGRVCLLGKISGPVQVKIRMDERPIMHAARAFCVRLGCAQIAQFEAMLQSSSKS
jgi:hypothetical protein